MKQSMKSMQEKQKESLSGFFKHYIEFVEVELYNSLTEKSIGRCEGVLYEFLKVIHAILIKENINDGDEKLFGKMIEVFKEYQAESIIKSAHRLKIDLKYQDIGSFIDDNFIELLDVFFVAINDFRQILPKIPLSEDIKLTFNIVDGKAPTFTQALLEFNNALAHIAVAMYHKDKQDTKANIKKAKAHLYRGSLDCYKMLIRFCLQAKKVSIF